MPATMLAVQEMQPAEGGGEMKARMAALAVALVALGGCDWRDNQSYYQMHQCVVEQINTTPGRASYTDLEDYAWALDICTKLGAGESGH